MAFCWLASVLVRHPRYVLVGLSIFCGLCLTVPLVFKNFPSFEDPDLGYQTRGTQIANKLTTWSNLVEATKEDGSLTVNPKEYLLRQNLTQLFAAQKMEEELGNKIYGRLSPRKNPRYTRRPRSTNLFEVKHLAPGSPYRKYQRRDWLSQLKHNGYFCGTPNGDYAHMVVESTNGADLFTLESLRSICHLQEVLIDSRHFKDLCIQKPQQRKMCCRPWSLPNYVASLRNRNSCRDITKADVAYTTRMLRTCSAYYHSAQIGEACTGDNGNTCGVPDECRQAEIIFSILHYINPTSFLPPNNAEQLALNQTMIFLPVACSSAVLPYYHEMLQKGFEHEGIKIVAMEFGLKRVLFNEYLLRDTWLLAAGASCVFMLMWFHTGSIFLTLMAIIAIFFSLGISYCVYTMILRIDYFPFMNLLAFVIAFGVGTDDAFVFLKVWTMMKLDSGAPLVILMDKTMDHTFVSMLVTSLTTSAALFASYISSITAIKCFSIFASVAVLANWLLMSLWFPACVVIWERNSLLHYNPFKDVFSAISARCWKPQFIRKLTYRQIRFYMPNCLFINEKDVAKFITKFRYCWFTSLSIVAVCCGYIVMYYPKMQLPDTNDFQLFRDTHPFEKYDMVYKHKFWFAKDAMEAAQENMPLRFIWGVIPQDNGNYMEPLSYGSLKMDESFNMSHPDSQLWMVDFCRNLRKQPFYKQSRGFMLPNCFIDTFITWMSRKCEDYMENTNHSPCCQSELFPYRSWVFEKCIVEAIADLYSTPPMYYPRGVAGPKFSKEADPKIKAVVIEYESNYTFSLSYNEMNNFVEVVNSWFNEIIKTAPETMSGGFFVSTMDFYDLQRVLSGGTLTAVFIAMGLALTVLFFTTLNIIISIYAIINITCSILVTMGILVLLGWKLNVLESIAISTAIGLTVDFALHYTVNYRLASSNSVSRLIAAQQSLSNMLKPVSMAALTTGIVGALMIPSTVMAYVQIGTFLVLVIGVSWVFSTFYLGAILAIAGPERNFGQCHYSHIFKKSSRQSRPVPAPPDPGPSTSEAFELELLTTKPFEPPLEPSSSESSFNFPPQSQFEQPPIPGTSMIVAAEVY